jgi:hypothetical protein
VTLVLLILRELRSRLEPLAGNPAADQGVVLTSLREKLIKPALVESAHGLLAISSRVGSEISKHISSDGRLCI